MSEDVSLLQDVCDAVLKLTLAFEGRRVKDVLLQIEVSEDAFWELARAAVENVPLVLTATHGNDAPPIPDRPPGDPITFHLAGVRITRPFPPEHPAAESRTEP